MSKLKKYVLIFKNPFRKTSYLHLTFSAVKDMHIHIGCNYRIWLKAIERIMSFICIKHLSMWHVCKTSLLFLTWATKFFRTGNRIFNLCTHMASQKLKILTYFPSLPTG